MAQQFVRQHKVGLSSVGVVILAIVALVAYALSASGYPVHRAKLHDDGIWVTTDALGQFGRINKAVKQFDGNVFAPTAAGGAELDIRQDGSAVAGWDKANGSLIPIEVAGVSLGTNDKATLGADSIVSMAGGTIAVLNTRSGALWAQSYSPDASLASLSALDMSAPRTVKSVGARAAMTVASNGTVFAVSAATGLTTLTPAGAGFRSASTHLDADLNGTLSITAVGSTPIVLVSAADGSRGSLLVQGSEPAVITGSNPVLQQPGSQTPDVLVATSESLLSVPLATPAAPVAIPVTDAGTPTAPVQLRGCLFAAWSGAPASAVTGCGSDKPRQYSLRTVATAPVLRVNRQQVLLNDTKTGDVWDLDNGAPAELDDWSKISPPKRQPSDTSTDNNDRTSSQQSKPPIAKGDALGARQDRTTALYILDNDSDPAGKVLSINSISDFSSSGKYFTIAPDRQTVLATLPRGANGSYSFKYTVSDGGSKPSSPALVTVGVAPDGQYKEPNTRIGFKDRTWATPVNGSITIPALIDWRNKFDGDPSVITGAEASSGSVLVTPQGDLVYSAPERPGEQTIKYTVADGNSAKVSSRVLHVTVQSDSARAVPAIAQNDFVQGQVGQPISIYPLDNDLPGSDPATVDAAMSIASNIAQPKGLRVTTDQTRGSVTVAAERAGQYLLTYQVGYGAAAPSKPAQVRIAVNPRSNTRPIAGPDSVVLRGQAPALVDVLANDFDASGNLLDVVSAKATSGSVPLQVAVVEGRWLRVNATQAVASPGSGVITYQVSDGVQTSSGEVSITELAPLESDPPVTRPDFATTRAGGSTVIAVLDNDINAGGDPITLAQNIGGAKAPGQLKVTSLDGAASGPLGAAYVSGNLVRYVAPAVVTVQRQVLVTYRAQSAGAVADGSITVTLTPPADPKTNPNHDPTPQNLEARVGAGGTVTIPVPTAGVDPDGDTVTVQGLGTPDSGSPAPQHGRLLSFTAGSLTYQAYPYLGNAGTDQFTYQVSDPNGAEATATVRVAVVAPDILPAPVAHAIAVTAAPGEHLRLHAVSPAYVDYPQGDPPMLQDPTKLNADPAATVTADRTPGWLDIVVPDHSSTGAVTVVYGVIGDLGETASAPIIITIKPGFKPPPVAVDQFAKLKPGTNTVSVNLLKGDADPAGGTIAVAAPSSATSGTLTVAVTAHPQVIPYVIKSTSGAQASANAYIPAGSGSAPYWNGKSIDLPKGATNVEINNYVTDPQNKSVRLGTVQQIWSSPSNGIRAVSHGVSGLTLTPVPGYNGPASVSFEVTDGLKLNSPGAKSAVITVPVQVGAKTPVLRCPTTPVQVVEGAPAGTPVNIASECHVWLPDPAAGPLRYNLSWKGAALNDVAFVNNDQQIPSVVAGHNARAGSRANILVTAASTSATAVLPVVVVTAPLLTVSAVAADGVHAGGTKQFDIGGYVNSPFGVGSVSVVSVTQNAGGAATASVSGKRGISVTPHQNVNGKLSFSFVVTDVDSGDTSRRVTGQIIIEVIDKPGAPTSVTPRPGLLSHEAVVTFVSPPDHGSPIDTYRVSYASSAGSGTRSCDASPCTISGLTNGASYRFTVMAHNPVGFGPASTQSAPDVPDAPPPAVTGFVSSTPLNHQITLSWNQDKPDGTPVDHYLISWPGGTKSVAGQASTTTTITGLSNTNTTFQVSAYNKAGHSPGSSTTGWPAGAPAAPANLTIGYANDTGSKTRTIVLQWDADPPNGQGPTKYAVTRSGVTVNCAENQPTLTSCTDQPPVGPTYTYSVTATNYAAAADPAHHTSPASQTTFAVASTPDRMDAPVAHAPAANDPDGYATVSFTTAPSNGQALTVLCSYTSDGSSPRGDSTACPGSPWAGYDRAGGTADTKALSGLPAGAGVQFAVWEDNGSNTGNESTASDPSAASNVVTTNAPPTAPPNGSCNLSGTTLNVNWAAATSRGSRTITNYRVYLDNSNMVDVGTAQSYSYGGRPADGASHSVQVYAFDGTDQGPGLNITGPNCNDPQPPPPPTVNLSRGSSTTAISSCPATCYYFHEQFHNFPIGTYSVECNDSTENNFYPPAKIKVTNSEMSIDGPCAIQAGYLMPVTVTILSVPYNGGVINVQSNQASW